MDNVSNALVDNCARDAYVLKFNDVNVEFSPQQNAIISKVDFPRDIMNEFLAQANLHNSKHGLPPIRSVAVIIVSEHIWDKFQEAILQLNENRKEETKEHKDAAQKREKIGMPHAGQVAGLESQNNSKREVKDNERTSEVSIGTSKIDEKNKEEKLKNDAASKRKHDIQEDYMYRTKTKRYLTKEQIEEDYRKFEDNKQS